MKRVVGHAAFALLSIAAAAVAVVETRARDAALAANARLAEASAAGAAAAQAAAEAAARTEATGTIVRPAPIPRMPLLDRPETALAFALALGGGGDHERALAAFETLITSRDPEIRQRARYALGNLHLREAMKIGDVQFARARTLVELAKQAYRQVLDEDPDHWPARYNLERALWLEPEADDGDVETTPPPSVERPNGDKPELP